MKCLQASYDYVGSLSTIIKIDGYLKKIDNGNDIALKKLNYREEN